MRLKTSSVAVLVVTLVGTPPLGRPLAPTHGGTGQPPVIGVAILPERPRVRRRTRVASIRTIGWRILRRLRPASPATGTYGQSLYSRLPLRDSLARGPPWVAQILRRQPGGVTAPG